MALKKLITIAITLTSIIAPFSSKSPFVTPEIVNKNGYMVVAEESEGDYSTIIAEVYRFNDEGFWVQNIHQAEDNEVYFFKSEAPPVQLGDKLKITFRKDTVVSVVEYEL